MLCGQCIFFDYLGRCHNGNTRRVERPYFAEACKYAEPKQKEQPKTTNTMNEEKTPTTKVCKTCGRELPIAELTKRGWKGTLTYVMTANLNCE